MEAMVCAVVLADDFTPPSCSVTCRNKYFLQATKLEQSEDNLSRKHDDAMQQYKETTGVVP